ncbi:MAG: hypothetical protein H7308_17775 [Chthonomonadaceae bacterium]|nr:hypothetical protein [Chthonomonadaceae bacterium]
MNSVKGIVLLALAAITVGASAYVVLKKNSVPPVKKNFAAQLCTPKTVWFCKAAWLSEGAGGECPTTITFSPDKTVIMVSTWKGKKLVDKGDYSVMGTTITGDFDHMGKHEFSMRIRNKLQVVSISTGRYTFERR